MSRKKSTNQQNLQGNQIDPQDVLKLYLDGQVEFRKALVTAATAISVQSENSRELVSAVKDLAAKLDDFEEKLDSLESRLSQSQTQLISLKESSEEELRSLRDSGRKELQTVRDTAINDLSKQKTAALVMMFFLALAGVLGAFSLAGSKIRTELGFKGVAIETKAELPPAKSP